MASVPSAVLDVADRVDRRLGELLRAERARWRAVGPELAEPFDALADLVLAGGKRIRPTFVHVAFVGAGGAPDDGRVTDLGAAFELLHAFALLHDDVMDGSPTRRGRRSAHVAFAEEHGAEGWRGESRRFGEGLAVLLGDLAFVGADRLLTPMPPAVRELWDEMRVELSLGQYVDLVASARGDRARATARSISRLKAATYTVERPLHLGAALAAPAAGDLRRALSGYGRPLGEAFQLRDDLLGAFGDARVTGKPVGEDLRAGKATPLLAAAVARADRPQAAVLDLVGGSDLTAAELEAVLLVVEATGARAEVEAEIERLVAEAIAALDAVPITDEAKKVLAELADFVAARDR